MSVEEMNSVAEPEFQPEVVAEGMDSVPDQPQTEYRSEEAPVHESIQADAPQSDPVQTDDDNIWMPEYGSDEYYQKFDSLPYKDQLKVEQGNFKWEKDREKFEQESVEQQEDAKPLAGDAPKQDTEEAPELGWDEDTFKTLDPHTQKTVMEMQEQLDAYSIYEKPEFKAILDTLEKDPMIQARLLELQGKDLNQVPSQVSRQFDPNNYVTKEMLEHLDFELDPQKAQETLQQILQNTYQDAVKRTNIANQYESQREIHEVELRNEVKGQIDTLMNSNESYKSNLPIHDTAHPLNPFLNWVRDNTTNETIKQFGMNGLHAVWMEQNGGRDEMIKNVQTETRNRFIRSMDKAKEQLTTVGRTTQTREVQQNNNNDGIDLNRYMADEAYARMMYDNASWSTQQKLEKYVTTGHYPAR